MTDTSSLFATAIANYNLADASLVEALEQAAWMLEDADEAGGQWCDTHGYDGYTSYASLDDLPVRDPAFGALKLKLDAFAKLFAQDQHWDMQGRKLVLDSLWVNILGEGGSHSGHIHPNSVISGTVYVVMPEGSGALKFEDPRLPMMMAAPPVHADAPEAFQRFAFRTPEAGTVLLWESWLRHEVMPSRAEAERISVSFNYSLEAA
ncbi:MAG: TIGR02466 family protein [Hyphomonadaceae bacterium]